MSRFNVQIAARIPRTMKKQLEVTARQRMLAESDIVREALREMFERDEPKQSPQPKEPETMAMA